LGLGKPDWDSHMVQASWAVKEQYHVLCQVYLPCRQQGMMIAIIVVGNLEPHHTDVTPQVSILTA
jgi:hypothetical protein